MRDRFDTLLAGPLALVASLHAATEVWRARSDRQRGHDASENEPDDQVLAHLRDATEILTELAFRAAATRVALDEQPADGVQARVLRFDGLLGVNRAAGILEDVHRRLMTLYPYIDISLIEDARVLARRCREALESEAALPGEDITEFVEQLRCEVLSP